MTPPARRPVRPMLALSCVAALLLLAVSAAGAEIRYEHISEQAWKTQLASGKIASVEINKRVRSLRTTLKDGRYVLAHYPKADLKRVESELQAKHVPFKVLTTAQAKATGEKHAVHHKLRYIVGGILIAIIVVVGAVLFIRRRGRGGD